MSLRGMASDANSRVRWRNGVGFRVALAVMFARSVLAQVPAPPPAATTEAVAAPAAPSAPAPAIPRFSSGKSGGPVSGWQPISLASYKQPTQYSLVDDETGVVLRAVSNHAASILGVRTDFDPHAFPILVWRWKVVKLVAEADTRERSREDAPARVMVSFGGDSHKLSFKDRAAAVAAGSISGEALPYAQLMYVWGSKVAVGSVTESALTSRIRMIAVAADADGVGEWRRYSRNMIDDFKRAFGEDPGVVTGISLMTDTDNTGSSAETLYGDILVAPR